ncbi:hypothetical protein JL720_2581 [Aureococcus anophagefferens]|nr:hypothetical protein JL720_2581 [Aureococcus anophagefferens]
MADFGEHLPLVGAHLHSGADPLAYHNQMPDDWARLARSAAVGSDALVFHRSGAPRTLESAGLFWAGDQEQSWQKNDGFASLPRTYVSSGLAGWTQHSDVGGMIFCETAWLCERTDELLARWLELSAVVDPVLRSHPSNGNDRVPQPWSDGSNLAATRRAVAIHVALRGYKRALLAAAARDRPSSVRHAGATDAARTASRAGGAHARRRRPRRPRPAAGAKTVNATVPPPCAGRAPARLGPGDPARAGRRRRAARAPGHARDPRAQRHGRRRRARRRGRRARARVVTQ